LKSITTNQIKMNTTSVWLCMYRLVRQVYIDPM